jgi:sulfoxide reductase heme-binding subunit YedZ
LVSVGDLSSARKAATVPGKRRGPWRRRVLRHVALFVTSAVGGVVVFAGLEPDDLRFRASMATAYVAMVLLGITLAIGPLAALRGRRYPVSTYLRRDVGIWSAIVAAAHAGIGLQVHARGRMSEYFVRRTAGSWIPRVDPFGVANYTGAATLVLFVLLLATSNDRALRTLGVARWQRVHACAQWALALTIVHGVAYQLLEKRSAGFVALFAVMALAVTAVRTLPARPTRKRS